MITDMKRFKMFHKTKTDIKDFLGDFLNSLFSFHIFRIMICLSHLQKDFSLFFFGCQVRVNYFTNMCKSISCGCPRINWRFTVFSALCGSIFARPTTKYFVNPFNHALICGSNFQYSLEKPISSIGIVSNKKRSFAIHEACHISSFCNGVFFSCVFAFCHDRYKHITRRNIKCTA